MQHAQYMLLFLALVEILIGFKNFMELHALTQVTRSCALLGMGIAVRVVQMLV